MTGRDSRWRSVTHNDQTIRVTPQNQQNFPVVVRLLHPHCNKNQKLLTSPSSYVVRSMWHSTEPKTTLLHYLVSFFSPRALLTLFHQLHIPLSLCLRFLEGLAVRTAGDHPARPVSHGHFKEGSIEACPPIS